MWKEYVEKYGLRKPRMSWSSIVWFIGAILVIGGVITIDYAMDVKTVWGKLITMKVIEVVNLFTVLLLFLLLALLINIKNKLELLNKFIPLSSESQKRIMAFIEEQSKIENFIRGNHNFSQLYKYIQEERQTESEYHVEGKISIQFEKGIELHGRVMELYKHRMDAVSDNNIRVWKGISPALQNNPDFESVRNRDIDIIAAYFEVISTKKKNNNTEITRIFLLDHKDQLANQKDIELFSYIIKEHLIDDIGVAVAYYENFGLGMNALIKRRDLKMDFALLNTDQAVTHFTSGSKRYELFMRNSMLPNLNKFIARQRLLHNTLIGASIMGCNKFEESLKNHRENDLYLINNRVIGLKKSMNLAYVKDESIKDQIEAETELSKKAGSIFSVLLNKDDTEEEIQRKLKLSISISNAYGPIIEPFVDDTNMHLV